MRAGRKAHAQKLTAATFMGYLGMIHVYNTQILYKNLIKAGLELRPGQNDQNKIEAQASIRIYTVFLFMFLYTHQTLAASSSCLYQPAN